MARHSQGRPRSPSPCGKGVSPPLGPMPGSFGQFPGQRRTHRHDHQPCFGRQGQSAYRTRQSVDRRPGPDQRSPVGCERRNIHGLVDHHQEQPRLSSIGLTSATIMVGKSHPGQVGDSPWKSGEHLPRNQAVFYGTSERTDARVSA